MNIERTTGGFPRTRTINLEVTITSEDEMRDIIYGLARAYNNSSIVVDRLFLEIGNDLGIPETDVLNG